MRLSSQSPPARTPERLRCLKEVRAYSQVFRAYARGADTRDRLALLLRLTNEGGSWMNRLQARSGALMTGEHELADQVKHALAAYNAAPTRLPREAGAAAVKLIPVAQALDRLEIALAR